MQINKLAPPAAVGVHYEHGAATANEGETQAAAFRAENIIRCLAEGQGAWKCVSVCWCVSLSSFGLRVT